MWMKDMDLENYRKGETYILPIELVYEMLAEIEEANVNGYWWQCRYNGQCKICKEYKKRMKKLSKKLNDELLKLGRITNTTASYVRDMLAADYEIYYKKK